MIEILERFTNDPAQPDSQPPDGEGQPSRAAVGWGRLGIRRHQIFEQPGRFEHPRGQVCCRGLQGRGDSARSSAALACESDEHGSFVLGHPVGLAEDVAGRFQSVDDTADAGRRDVERH